jgi:phage shock protein E
MLKILLSLISLLNLNAYAISTDEIQALKEEKAVIIDIREKDEIETGMIDKAIWFPMSKIYQDKQWSESFKQHAKDKKVFIYCRSGSRVESVKKELKRLGIEATNLGGYNSLKSKLPSIIPNKNNCSTC